MRILFVADGRSPIALNWIAYLIRAGHEVHLASTFSCELHPGLVSQQVIPVAFSAIKAFQSGRSAQSFGRHGLWSAAMLPLRTKLRQALAPLTLPGAARRLAAYIQQARPDLVHAMRIPYEGMLASLALEQMTSPPPLVISVWGNDFTLHARSTPWMAALTRRALRSAQALHTDCARDQRLAVRWGFDPTAPSIVLPSGGGIQMDIFYPPSDPRPKDPSLVVNPRGFRAYVRNDTFFKAVALVLEQNSQIHFLCPAMAGEAQAERWLKRIGGQSVVQLLPPLPRPAMADLFRRARIAVSPTTHDGTPNTLLEAMACGCFPIASDLESVREWITPGENGILFNPGDPQALAEAILDALADEPLLQQAQQRNVELILQRAEHGSVMRAAEDFYLRQVLSLSSARR